MIYHLGETNRLSNTANVKSLIVGDFQDYMSIVDINRLLARSEINF